MLALVVAIAASALAQNGAPRPAELPTGRVIPMVTCVQDATESYALYLPAAYTPDRAWPVIFAFDPGGRGQNGVDRYQAAAEQYGFIVAGSNNSRNGRPAGKAIESMSGDVIARFHVDARRMYTAGMSGGARVAMSIALSSTKVAGVMASSAGYPDGQLRKSLRFPVFATAGTEDFNHLEMRQVDAALTTPHHLAVFEGPHVWLSSALAIEAVEWMEVQAMKSGIKPRDDKELDQLFTKRTAAAAAATNDKDAFLALQSIVADFDGLKDVTTFAARLAALGKDKNVREALKKDRDEDEREMRLLDDVRAAEDRLDTNNPATRAETLQELRRRWKNLSDQAKAPEDSLDRRLARRVLSSLGASVTSNDADYLSIVREFRMGRGGRP
jgi:hypothetical protein